MRTEHVQILTPSLNVGVLSPTVGRRSPRLGAVGSDSRVSTEPATEAMLGMSGVDTGTRVLDLTRGAWKCDSRAYLAPTTIQTDLIKIQNIPCTVSQECGQEQIGQLAQKKSDKLLERAAKGKLKTRVVVM